MRNPQLRSRPICGLPILTGLKIEGTAWEGSVYDPHRGKTFSVEVTLKAPNTLEVHGYLGLKLMGETQIWSRALGTVPRCSRPAHNKIGSKSPPPNKLCAWLIGMPEFNAVADQQKVVAITGGSGQLGTLILQRLVALHDVGRILCIDLVPPRIASTKLQFIPLDIRDFDLPRYFAGCDTVIHCAFIVTRGATPEDFRSVNVGGSSNVFDSAAAAGVNTIVYMSSITAYGCLPNHPVPITESTPRIDQPELPYASCKYAVEAFLDGFRKHIRTSR